jgi:hypothetical protein
MNGSMNIHCIKHVCVRKTTLRSGTKYTEFMFESSNGTQFVVTAFAAEGQYAQVHELPEVDDTQEAA